MKNIPKEKFQFAGPEAGTEEAAFDHKAVGYFRDAWNRFRKNRFSVVAALIIIAIVLYALLVPAFSRLDATFLDTYYAKKGPRNLTLAKLGIADGTVKRDLSEKGLIRAVAIGMGAEGGVALEAGLESDYQPVRREGKETVTLDAAKRQRTTYAGSKVDVYLEVGFLYRSIRREEYDQILAWQQQTGLQVLYPLVEENAFNPDPADANIWYKCNEKGEAITGEGTVIRYGPGMVLEDNYRRDSGGNLVYSQHTGGGDFESAQYRVRVLYYNYYRYRNGFQPEYLLGTDSQGYDLALRLAGGLKLSLLVAVSVSLINFVLGALYGAAEGYYGGTLDIVMERVSDILSGVPFVVVATLFQIHLAARAGPVPSLLFAFVLTGWIGTAHRVRSQFYRYKHQEYVMAARTLGASDRRIIWKHIFPNTLGTIITSSALVIPGVIFSESMLSYLGIVKLGSSGTTSLGTLLSDASGIWTNYPHLMLFPALFISLLMISFNLFGNGLRDAFNPSLRGVEE